MRFRLGFMAAIAFAAVSVIGVAKATTVSGSYSTVIGAGTDSLGFFGGGSLAGKTMLMSYSFDPAAPGINDVGGAGNDAITCNGCSSNFQFSVTIDGIVFSSIFTGYAQIVLQPVGVDKAQLTIGESGSFTQNVFFSLILDDVWIPGQLTSGSPLAGLTTDSHFGSVVVLQTNSDYDYITFTGQPAPAAAPEPASLALLGGGLIGLAALRRRRSDVGDRLR